MPDPSSVILSKSLLPTGLDAGGIRAALPAGLLRRCIFSARQACEGYLRDLRAILAEVAGGALGRPDARFRLLRSLADHGVTRQPGDLLTDHASERRLNLIIDTNRDIAHSQGRLDAQTPDVLDRWPAWRLTRFEGRAAPRDWPLRWRAAGEAVGWEGALRDPRLMTALKSSPIWQALGDGAGGFRDTLRNPFPPFAYGSGMDWLDVTRDEAARLGLIPS